MTGALVLLGAGFYLWILFERWAQLSAWGNLGSAVGPFAGLATVGALMAALWSVKLQREELRLQREEMRESRRELARSAKAQEDLARAQRASTAALVRANDQAELSRQAQISLVQGQQAANALQREGNAAAVRLFEAQLLQTVAHIEAALAQAESTRFASPAAASGNMDPRRLTRSDEDLVDRRKELLNELARLRRLQREGDHG